MTFQYRKCQIDPALSHRPACRSKPAQRTLTWEMWLRRWRSSTLCCRQEPSFAGVFWMACIDGRPRTQTSCAASFNRNRTSPFLQLLEWIHQPAWICFAPQEPVDACADLYMAQTAQFSTVYFSSVYPQEPVDLCADLYMDAGSVLLNVGQPDKALPFLRCPGSS